MQIRGLAELGDHVGRAHRLGEHGVVVADRVLVLGNRGGGRALSVPGSQGRAPAPVQLRRPDHHPPQKASIPSARSAVPLLDEILIAHEKTLQSEPRSPGRDHTDATRTPGGPLPGATAAGKPAAPRPVPRLTESRPVTCERGLHVWV
jgi:hypothetical protein